MPLNLFAYMNKIHLSITPILLSSFPGSFIRGKEDPGSGWSRASQKEGGDKKTAEGRRNQVAILSFLNSLWKFCVKI